MSEFEETRRTHLRRYRDFGSYDKATIYSIVDSAPMCHISTIIDDAPYVQATVHWRDGDKVYAHGAVENKMVKAVRAGAEACLSFTHFDGYVLTRSAINHAVLYRSVVAFSQGRFVDDLEEKNALLEAFIESVHPGRWETVRHPTKDELKRTGVVEFELKEVSAKILPREITPLVFPGGEMEAEEDATVSPWTGIVPYRLVPDDPIDSSDISQPPNERS